jgi:lactase-phlorizin hydrolase
MTIYYFILNLLNNYPQKLQHGWYASPLYYGKYPDIMRETVDRLSAAEGLNSSRLPEFDEEWKAIITGTVDFLGMEN